jgi:PAS domain S-box-containing protein
MNSSSDLPKGISFVGNGGEMGEMIAGKDWKNSLLGEPEIWPAQLKQLTATMLSTPSPMLICWGDYWAQLYNDAFRPILGSTKHPAALGIPVYETYAEIWPTLEPMFHQVMRGEAVTFKEFHLKMDRNGFLEDTYFDFSYSPIKDEFGNVKGILVICTETTDKVNSLKAITDSEERFRTMAEGTDILIAVGDETGNATYFNTSWVKLTGRPMADLLSFGWVDLVHPDDKDRYVNIYLNAFRVKSPFTGEFRVKNLAGEYRWLLAQGSPRLTSDGGLAGYISACLDITDRKREQEESQKIFEQARLSKEAAQLGTFDMDLVNHTMDWDSRCRKLFGISHNNRVTYENDFLRGLHPEDRHRISKLIEDAFDKERSNGEYDVEYRTIGVDDAKIRWVRAKGKVYFDDQNKPLRFIGSVLDITDQVNVVAKIEQTVKERTRELADANDKLQKSNADLAQFAYIASHDLQEPLRKIKTFAQMLERSLGEKAGSDSINYLNKIQGSSTRMSTLIHDVLVYSELAKENELFYHVDLNDIVSAVLDDFDLQIEEKNAEIQIGKLPVVEAIPLQMTQLFGNLLGNALKFCRTNKLPRIQIKSEELLVKEYSESSYSLNPNLIYYRIQFCDNGIGFDVKFVEQVFGIFQRLHKKSEYTGTGIGLAMCKKIVLNHHGYIDANGSSENGAIFNIILPVSQQVTTIPTIL